MPARVRCLDCGYTTPMARADPSRGAGDPQAAVGDARSAAATPAPRRPVRPAASGVPLDQTFDQGLLYVLRSAVAAHAAALGADEDTTFQVVIIAGELAANAIRHGGGGGRLRLWAEDGHLTCEVSDAGRGMADPGAAGTREPPATAAGGRGIWIVRQLAARVVIDSGPHGTTVTASVPVDAPPA